jgi:hypothetical protein
MDDERCHNVDLPLICATARDALAVRAARALVAGLDPHDHVSVRQTVQLHGQTDSVEGDGGGVAVERWRGPAGGAGVAIDALSSSALAGPGLMGLAAARPEHSGLSGILSDRLVLIASDGSVPLRPGYLERPHLGRPEGLVFAIVTGASVLVELAEGETDPRIAAVFLSNAREMRMTRAQAGTLSRLLLAEWSDPSTVHARLNQPLIVSRGDAREADRQWVLATVGHLMVSQGEHDPATAIPLSWTVVE